MILMLDTFLMKPESWFIPWILRAVAYYFVLKKMGLRYWTAAVPFLAEREMSTVLFRRMRTFYRPFIISAVFMAGAYYLGPEEKLGYAYMMVAYVVYSLFLLRLYYRLSKSFGKGIIYTILTALFPTLFLLILGLGRSEYHPLEFREERQHGEFLNRLRRITVAAISLVEIVVLVLVVGFFSVRAYPPRILVSQLLKNVNEQSKDIESDGKALSREDTMGMSSADLAEMPSSRDYFFPDHSGDKSVVVMEYVIGADLEDHSGMASANINMMKSATEKGDGLTFVLEAGGSRRWFTSGIKENGYGRYTVSGGKVEMVENMVDKTSMEEPSRLENFIKWTAKNYPADRYILVFWDHGGGVAYGYGVDQLSHRDDAEGFKGLRVSDVVNSVKNSGVKFDLIGFDACLMQDIEIASSFEPYADYFLASEETEDGLGWYYTSAFGALAADPGMSTEEFGKNIISSYDQFNTIINDGTPKPKNTLSLVDLTRVKPAYEQLEELYVKADEALNADQNDFAEIALAAMNSYSFVDNLQIDAVDFVEKLSDTDVNDSVCTQDEKSDTVKALKACVVYRNKDSAEGINGISTALPYKSIQHYTSTEKELKTLGFNEQRALFNDLFSVIAVQKKQEHDSKPDKYNTIGEIIQELKYVDYTQEEWYVKGFEDIDPSATILDIPVKDTGEGYSIQLPEKTWNIIADCVTAVYQKTDDGRYRYLGSDHRGGEDADGHPMVDMDDRWVHINDRLVCYEDYGAIETEEGVVYSGEVKARLNGSEDIIIQVEWDAVSDSEDESDNGKVTGYQFVSDLNKPGPLQKGIQKFQSGDRIEFLFEYYDENGELVSTEAYGNTIYVNTMDRLKVTDSPLEECDIEFLGMLIDAYQRQYLTEIIEAHIGE